MKKLISATAVCALAIGLVAVPGAVAKKGPKLVGATVSVGVTPIELSNATTSVSVSGNVGASSSCRKDRTLHFQWVTPYAVGAVVGTATTRSNGDFSASVPRPADTFPTTPSVTLRTTVDQVTRKVGSKKKGKKDKKGRVFVCLGTSTDVPVALSA